MKDSILLFASILIGSVLTLVLGPQAGVVSGLVVYLLGSNFLLKKQIQQLAAEQKKQFSDMPELIEKVLLQESKNGSESVSDNNSSVDSVKPEIKNQVVEDIKNEQACTDEKTNEAAQQLNTKLDSFVEKFDTLIGLMVGNEQEKRNESHGLQENGDISASKENQMHIDLNLKYTQNVSYISKSDAVVFPRIKVPPQTTRETESNFSGSSLTDLHEHLVKQNNISGSNSENLLLDQLDPKTIKLLKEHEALKPILAKMAALLENTERETKEPLAVGAVPLSEKQSQKTNYKHSTEHLRSELDLLSMELRQSIERAGKTD